MAFTTEVSYTQSGSTNKDFIITFPFLASTDVKVQKDGVTQPTSAYTITGSTVTFGTAPSAGDVIKLFRDTDIDKSKITFQTGASIRAQDLNDSAKQTLYAIQEQEQASTTASGTGLALTTGSKNHVTVNSANDWTLSATAVRNALGDDSIDSNHYVDLSIDNQHIANLAIQNEKIANTTITGGKLANSTVTGTQLANDCTDSQHYVDGSIDNQHIADLAIQSEKIAQATIIGPKIAADTIKEENLKIDNAPTNDDVLTAKSSAAGGLTWATLAEAAPAGFQIGFGYASTTTKKEFTSNNTWDDSGLEITYTPKSSSSLLLIEARPLLRCRPSGNPNSAYFEIRYELDNSGNDLDGAMGIHYGYASNLSVYAYYSAQQNQPILLTTVYTNSNTNQKIFKVQGRAPSGTADFQMNANDQYYGLNTGKSYITIKEIAN
tara:strand:- start:1362 stop:2669 length:1308 start_codon:yes stop_codon:yes gene_type:complete